MSLAVAIDVLRAELRAVHGQVDDATAIGVALGGLAVLSALARTAPAAPTAGVAAAPPPVDTARIGQMVLADIAAAGHQAPAAARATTGRGAATAPPPETPEPPLPRPAAVAAPPADDAPRSTSSAQALPQAAEPAGTSGRDSPVWTQERRALLAELWPTLTPASDILQRINALPGERVRSADAVGAQAQKIGVRRPAKRALSEARRQQLREAMAAVRQRRKGRGYKAVRRTLTDGTVREYRYCTGGQAAPAEPEAAVTPPEMPRAAVPAEMPGRQSAAPVAEPGPGPSGDCTEGAAEARVPPPLREPPPANAAAARPSLKDRVRAAMRQGVKDWAIWAGQQKTPLREVYRLRGEIAREAADSGA
jgi:hypothetical protein